MKIFHDKMEELGLNHSEPYDTRHTFATIAKTAHVEEGARQLITVSYTHLDVYKRQP